MHHNFILIGVDGGATKINAWEIRFDEQTKKFTLGTLNAQRSYKDIPGFQADFEPVHIAVQIPEMLDGTTKATESEKQQEAVYVEACAQVIEKLSRQSGKDAVLTGIGMPGLKTENKRGIAAVANGPRMLHYSDLLEERLNLSQINFVAPVYHLGSDADYCGIGENFSKDGLFKDVENAYYLGGGTGVADALKLKRNLLPFDKTKEWLAKSWEMKSADGRSLERFASAGGIQSLYAAISGKSIQELNAQKFYPLQISEQAAKGDPDSIETLALTAQQLSLLLYERITTLYSGWQGLFYFMNGNRAPLDARHPFLGTLLDSIIIGQRLGELMDSDHGKETLYKPLLERLNHHIQKSTVLDEKAKTHYSDLNKMIKISRLREAPAIGAGIDAFQNYHKEK